jgi:hypothetical protein
MEVVFMTLCHMLVGIDAVDGSSYRKWHFFIDIGI